MNRLFFVFTSEDFLFNLRLCCFLLPLTLASSTTKSVPREGINWLEGGAKEAAGEVLGSFSKPLQQAAWETAV